MSLLLDALKRAEQEKLAKQGGAPAEPAKERAAPVALAPPPRAASLELQPLGAGGDAATGPAANAARADAQNVFQAKDARAQSNSNRATVAWIVGIVVVVALIGGAGYVWYSINAFTPRTLANSRPRPVPINAAPTPAPAGPGTPGPFVAAPDVGQPVGSVAATPAASPPPAVNPPAPEVHAAPAARPDAVRDAVAALLRQTPPSAPQEVRLAPSREQRRVSVDVASGYHALAAGDMAAARKSYVAALSADPANLDALLGMGTIEARNGNRMLAANYYRKALDVDPRDATARAGLAALTASERPDGVESQLRGDLEHAPGSAALHFALGNLLASQNRWNEAQVEFFDAYRLDPANADLAYNLAVSLDHLKQTKLAAEYYSRALQAAPGTAAQFDPALAARRLAQIRG